MSNYLPITYGLSGNCILVFYKILCDSYSVFDVLQSGSEGLNQAGGNIRYEAHGVHVDDGHVIRQRPRVGRNIERRKQLVLRFKGDILSQCLDKTCLSWNQSSSEGINSYNTGKLANSRLVENFELSFFVTFSAILWLSSYYPVVSGVIKM